MKLENWDAATCSTLAQVLVYRDSGPPRGWGGGGGGGRGYFPGVPKNVLRKGAPQGFSIFNLSGLHLHAISFSSISIALSD